MAGTDASAARRSGWGPWLIGLSGLFAMLFGTAFWFRVQAAQWDVRLARDKQRPTDVLTILNHPKFGPGYNLWLKREAGGGPREATSLALRKWIQQAAQEVKFPPNEANPQVVPNRTGAVRGMTEILAEFKLESVRLRALTAFILKVEDSPMGIAAKSLILRPVEGVKNRWEGKVVFSAFTTAE